MDRRRVLQTGWICALLAVLVLWVYWPARHFDFVQFDDNDYVFENETVLKGITSWGFVWAFVDFHASNYHPLTWLSHMLDCELFGADPGAHHLVNVALHALNAALVFLMMRSLTGSTWRSALVGALFALHPLRVESVAWISERKDLLSGCFFALALLAYARFVRRSGGGGAVGGAWSFLRARDYWVVMGVFVLGLLSKPMLVTLPAVLLLLDVWPLRRVELSRLIDVRKWLEHTGTSRARPDSQAPTGTSRARPGWQGLLLEKVPLLGVAFVFSLFTALAQQATGAIKSVGPGERLANTVAAYWGYLQKTFWPADLAVVYLRGPEISSVTIAGGAAVLVLLTGLVLWRIRREPFIAVGWFWFLGMLLPVSGIVSIGDIYMADRYTYLPGIGLLIGLVWGGERLLRRFIVARKGRFAVTVAAAALVVAATLATREQLRVWQDTETLMTRVLAIDPDNFVAHVNLAVHYTRKGDETLARHHRALATPLVKRALDKSGKPEAPEK